MTRTLDDVLVDEMAARVNLNALRDARSRLDAECDTALAKLNDLKREAYRMGFTGNIMRDANGNRLNALSVRVQKPRPKGWWKP